MRSAQRAEIVVVTGASAGIGRATAKLFAQRGAVVALLARGVAGLDGARQEIEAAGGRALMIPTDVADAAQLESAAQRIEAELGSIDIWINCAMATVFAPVADITPEEFRRATDVTYHGAVYGTMAAYQRMRKRNRGTIVQVSSALAYRSIPLQSAYCGAKAALRGFTDSLRSELIHDGSRIHLCTVVLSAFNTPQFLWGRTKLPNQAQPVAPVFQPEFAARAIYWAAHHRRRELRVGFPVYKALFAQTFLPALADRILARKAWAGQMTDQPVKPGRPDNLFAPADGAYGDFGTHGPFDACAVENSIQLWLATHRGVLALGTAAITLCLGFLAFAFL